MNWAHCGGNLAVVFRTKILHVYGFDSVMQDLIMLDGYTYNPYKSIQLPRKFGPTGLSLLAISNLVRAMHVRVQHGRESGTSGGVQIFGVLQAWLLLYY